MRLVTLCSLLLGLAAAAHAVPSLVKPVSEAVTVVYDDTGNWGGDMSNHITHQSGSAYRARKILDLSAVPQATWDRTQTVRLSLYLMVHDYSFHDCPQINGLDEAFQVIINGQVHEYPMRAGAPVMAQDSIPNMDWHDLVIPKAELRRGPNEIVIAKAPGKIGQPDARPDDYLYLGIDSSRKRGNSAVAFDGQTWTQERLTVPGGNGEYMVRLYLIAGTASVRAVWRGSAVRVQGSGVRAGSGARRPSAPDRDDPAGILLYAGARGVKPAPEGCRLTAGQSARVEWDPAGFDRLEPLRVSVQVRGPARMQWLDARGEPAREPAIAGLAGTLPAGRTLKPSGVVITAAGEATVQSVTVEGSRGFHQPQPRINMAPAIADPPATQPRRPACRVEPKAVTLAGGFTQAVFERGDHLRLRSLKNLISRSEMLRHPNAVALFLVEVAGRRYAGSRDFRLVGLKAKGNGFEAILEGPATGNRPAAPAGAASRPASTNAPAGAPTAGAASPPAGIHAMAGAPTAGAQFRIVLSISASAEGLRMAMNLINIGRAPADFKLAFPHLSGLAVSEKPEEDYYFYPFGGGIIADAPALIRHGYGDHEALYQVMDLFSPARGCGLSLRTDDTQGWHKILALRKHVPERAVVNDRRTAADQFVRPEYRWGNSLDAEIEGTSFSYEYLRRRRSVGSMGSVGSVGSGAGPHSPYSPYSPHFPYSLPPGGDAAQLQKTANFAPAPVVIAVHPGDWHVAMQRYSDWAHRAWKFRPCPSALKSIHNMLSAGWGQGILFKEGAYRTDIIKPMTDCIELMSWWDWSPLGPFNTPLDQLDKVLTPAQIQALKPYLVKDPITGQMMWNNQPGDYRGYNARFGGLPAFRKAIETYRQMGAFVTLYTDPLRLDGNDEVGRKFGKEWCVVSNNGKKHTGYEVWNPCHGLAAVREWVGATMGRVIRETGADGIRLDEYGHRGWACYDETHKHTYQEPGVTQWMKGIADASRRAHAQMDQANSGSVLTTEFPGYDYLMQYLDGCITYDLTVLRSPLRPLECNAQRFYFPECKAYEIHIGPDRECHKRFWNAVECFDLRYPTRMYRILTENEEVYQGRECTPLVPTLQPFLYANRFRGAGKTMVHLYNATGHTFEGPALSVAPADAGIHAIELLHGEELPIVEDRVSLCLARDEVACVAFLPRLLQVKPGGQVQIRDGRGGQIVVTDDKGENVLTQNVAGKGGTLDLSKVPANAKPACLKLLRAGQMVDTVQWTAR